MKKSVVKKKTPKPKPLKRTAMRKARRAIATAQSKFYKPPKRKIIDKIVERIIDKYKLRGTNLEQYFRLWAICAMLNAEALCRNWKTR